MVSVGKLRTWCRHITRQILESRSMMRYPASLLLGLLHSRFATFTRITFRCQYVFLKILELSRSKACQSNRSVTNKSTGKASQNKLLRFVVPWRHRPTQKSLPNLAYESAPHNYAILQLNHPAVAQPFWLLLVRLVKARLNLMS